MTTVLELATWCRPISAVTRGFLLSPIPKQYSWWAPGKPQSSNFVFPRADAY